MSEHPEQSIWAQGGIGIHTGAANIIAGADAVVMDSQLALLGDAETSPDIRQSLRAMDGSETAIIFGHRVYTRPDLHSCTNEDELLQRLGHVTFSAPRSPADKMLHRTAYVGTISDGSRRHHRPRRCHRARTSLDE